MNSVKKKLASVLQPAVNATGEGSPDQEEDTQVVDDGGTKGLVGDHGGEEHGEDDAAVAIEEAGKYHEGRGPGSIIEPDHRGVEVSGSDARGVIRVKEE
jgi:hypothetical protein